MSATHAVLALFGHDPDGADDAAWSGANILARAAVKLDAFITGLSKSAPAGQPPTSTNDGK